MSTRVLFPALTAISMICLGIANAQKVYWTNSDRISRADLDGSNVEDVLVRTIYDPFGIAINSETSSVYWIDNSDGLSRGDLNGPCREILVSDSHNGVGIALDQINGWIYWSQGYYSDANGRIRRARFDGSNVQNLVTNIYAPRGVALDLIHGKLYWTEYGCGQGCGRIRRAGLDGSAPEVILAGLNPPEGLALDLDAHRMYWTEGSTFGPSRIRSADTTGQNIVDLPIGDIHRPTGIAIDTASQRTVWAEKSGNTNLPPRIRSANLDESNVVELVPDCGGAPWGVAIQDGFVYWSRNHTSSIGTIQRLLLLGGTSELVIASDVTHPVWLEIAPALHRMYWFDSGQRAIKSAGLDGREAQKVATVYGWVAGLTLDLENDHIYWSDNGRLRRSRTNGTEFETIIDMPNELHISRLAWDPLSQKLYWTQNHPEVIQRANGDGSNIELLLDVEPNSLRGIALDSNEAMLYWSQSIFGLRRANLDGAEIEDLVDQAEQLQPNELALDISNAKMYWTAGAGSGLGARIQRSNLDGTEVENVVLFPANLNQPNGIAISTAAHIADSSPTGYGIDARQPHDINDPTFRYGWSEIEIEFSNVLALEDPLDFEIIETGGDSVPPAIESVQTIAQATVRIALDDIIEPGAWTCFHHINSGTKSCLGYLPGDVNGDGTSSPADILHLIDSLNGVVDQYGIWQTDINRSGSGEPSDILRLIDLLNGGETLDPWNGRKLQVCP